MTREEILSHVDHTLLKPEATWPQIQTLCDEAIAIIGGADGPTAIFVTSRMEAQELWGLCVKVFSNVIVVVLNYLFSKRIIFKK